MSFSKIMENSFKQLKNILKTLQPTQTCFNLLQPANCQSNILTPTPTCSYLLQPTPTCYLLIKYTYNEQTLSLVAKLTTVRLFFAIATAKQWPLHQLEINNAFLHGYLDEEVYMLPPQGYFYGLPGQVSKLQRPLYGLKQASRQWNVEMTKFL